MMNLNIFGYQQSSLIDYPGEVSSVLFLNGCNLKCPYCHNKIHMRKDKEFNLEDKDKAIKDCLSNISSAIVISGGEPTLQNKSLIDLLIFFRNNSDKKIKLDTNGTNPIVLRNIFEQKLIDFIAMDIKAPFLKYQKYFNMSQKEHLLFDSVNIIKKYNIPHQFRTTEWIGLSDDDKKWINQHFENIKWQKYFELY